MEIKKVGTKIYFREWLSRKCHITYTTYTKLNHQDKMDIQKEYHESKERRHGTETIEYEEYNNY